MAISLLPHYSGIQHLVLDGIDAFHCFLRYGSLSISDFVVLNFPSSFWVLSTTYLKICDIEMCGFFDTAIH